MDVSDYQCRRCGAPLVALPEFGPGSKSVPTCARTGLSEDVCGDARLRHPLTEPGDNAWAVERVRAARAQLRQIKAGLASSPRSAQAAWAERESARGGFLWELRQQEAARRAALPPEEADAEARLDAALAQLRSESLGDEAARDGVGQE